MSNDKKGCDIEEICKEIDKCQILCIECHNIVTDLEIKIGFIKIKTQLSKQSVNKKYVNEEDLLEYKQQYQLMFTSLQKHLQTEIRLIKN